MLNDCFRNKTLIQTHIEWRQSVLWTAFSYHSKPIPTSVSGLFWAMELAAQNDYFGNRMRIIKIILYRRVEGQSVTRKLKSLNNYLDLGQ